MLSNTGAGGLTNLVYCRSVGVEMKRIFVAVSVVSLFAVGLGYAGGRQAAKGHSTDVQAIKSTEEQWNKDFQSKNVDALLAHYTDDATLMGPGMPAAMGKDAIRASLKEMVADPALVLTFQPRRVEVAKFGDLAFTEGSYNMIMTDAATKKSIQDKGSYVTVYRKQSDGSWKAVSDIAT
jgi:uncharacterized protein (TIGR02246 family)